MPQVRHPISRACEAFLRFVNGGRAVGDVPAEGEQRARQLALEFTLAMIRLGREPPQDVEIPPPRGRRTKAAVRKTGHCLAAVDGLAGLVRETLGSGGGLDELAAWLRQDAELLLWEVLRQGNRPSLGVCQSCGQVFARDTKTRSATHPEGHDEPCYQRWYDANQRDRSPEERERRAQELREKRERIRLGREEEEREELQSAIQRVRDSRCVPADKDRIIRLLTEGLFEAGNVDRAIESSLKISRVPPQPDGRAVLRGDVPVGSE